jgi:E3 ubiquitin-protein ligase UBR7
MNAPERADASHGNASISDTKDAPKSSLSQVSQHSQTASDFIDGQLQLEADAREALPYAFDHCTQPLGPLRQNLFSCLTCNPPPQSPSDPYTPAAVCYSCSIACHGEHTLVELFNRRNFTCDCGTARLPETSPCTLPIDPATGMKGPVHSQAPAEGNTYNQNCRNRFCGCGEVYNAEEEKGTMFQCLGLAGESEGGCGEDWWHPECVLGLGREWAKVSKDQVKEEANGAPNEGEEAEAGHPMPPGFPLEDDFDTFICYKCVDAIPWIKRYTGSVGFLPPVYHSSLENTDRLSTDMEQDAQRYISPF